MCMVLHSIMKWTCLRRGRRVKKSPKSCLRSLWTAPNAMGPTRRRVIKVQFCLFTRFVAILQLWKCVFMTVSHVRNWGYGGNSSVEYVLLRWAVKSSLSTRAFQVLEIKYIWNFSRDSKKKISYFKRQNKLKIRDHS